MTTNPERELEKMLTGGPVPEPPADLVEKITAEIPERIELHPDLEADRDDTVVPLHRRRAPWYAAAAAVATLALTAAVTWELRQTTPEVAPTPITRTSGKAEEARAAPGESPEATAVVVDAAPVRPNDAGPSEDEGNDAETRRERSDAPRARVLAEQAPADDNEVDVAAAPAPPSSAVDRDRRRDPAGAGRSRQLSLGLVDESAAAAEPPMPATGGLTMITKSGSTATSGGDRDHAAGVEREQKAARKATTSERFADRATVSAPSSEEPAQIRGIGSISEVVVVDPAASTGGTAEPNDAPYGDVFFAEAGVNPFVDVDDDRLSTFGLEVDTGSYSVVRRFLRDGHLPPREAVRVEELVNAFDYGDRPPRRDDFRLSAEGGPTPFTLSDRYRLVRFAVAAREVGAAERPPATLVFVVDVSGSMDRENRLGLVRDALGELLGELRSDDRVGLVVYGSRGEVLLEPTSDLGRVRAAIGRLRAGGSTNAEEGLVLGYGLAAEHLEPGRIARVILCSDGVANVGRTGPGSILERIRRDVDRGIELTAVGFGMGNYNDALMERLADTGDGRYAYVDTLAEARRIFVDELSGTLYTVAREAKAQIEFDPSAVSRWRLLGYENRDIADDRFRDPTVDAGEIGAGHTVTALYEVKLAGDARDRDTMATLRVRYRPADSDRPVELEQRIRVSDLAPSWDAAPPSLRLAAIVAEYGELLKGAYWAKDGSMDRVLSELQRLQPEFAGDGRVAGFVGLVATARDLMEPPPRDRDREE